MATQITKIQKGERQNATLTLGVVSYLNALPLYQALTAKAGLTIRAAVPAELDQLLRTGVCDAAMLPVVDFFRRRESLRPISDGCIASDGETMTVRVFSSIPPDKVRRLRIDGHSHTSIILAQVVWRELYGTELELEPNEGAQEGDDSLKIDSVLLIGDKVIHHAPRGFGFEVDLGAAWKHLTGLPFVFAAWYAEKDRALPGLDDLLAGARDKGVAMAENLANTHAGAHGWPKSIAVEYLCRTLKYKMTPAMHEAMDRFHELAEKYRLL
jgi:chorismate dehydratase